MSTDLEPSTRDPLLGEVIGGEFEIKEKLGEGGMGSVYLATQAKTERAVAIKVLPRSLTDDNLASRFKQEAQIVSKLSHPGIITIYTYGQHSDRTLYIAMELVRGKSLADLLEDSSGFDVDRALPLMIQMTDALAYAHDQKIIHRDIKPQNVMITRTGRSESVKVLDFGIAKMLDGNAALTRTGTLCGSPIFMSPEQWHQLRDIDGRTDIYSLGCVFYQMMAGRPPHEADTTIGYMMAHTQHRPAPVGDVSLTISQLPQLGDIIMRCLATDRADRYPDMYALLDALKDADVAFQAQRRPGTPSPGSLSPPSVRPAAASPPPKHLAQTVAGTARPMRATSGPTGDDIHVSLSDVGAPANDTSEPAAKGPALSERPGAPEKAAPGPEGTSAFRVQQGPKGAEPDRAHYVLAAVGGVMIVLLAVAVFGTH